MGENWCLIKRHKCKPWKWVECAIMGRLWQSKRLRTLERDSSFWGEKCSGKKFQWQRKILIEPIPAVLNAAVLWEQGPTWAKASSRSCTSGCSAPGRSSLCTEWAETPPPSDWGSRDTTYREAGRMRVMQFATMQQYVCRTSNSSCGKTSKPVKLKIEADWGLSVSVWEHLLRYVSFFTCSCNSMHINLS